MPTLGEELRRRREERGTSLSDISEATRIGTRFLKAIEMDNFSILPGGIFTRSFIRSFAREVGMNEEEAISLYQQQIGGQAAEPQPSVATEQRAQSIAPAEPFRPVAPAEPRPRRTDPFTYRQPAARANWSTIIILGGVAVFVVLIVLALVKQFSRPSPGSPAQAVGAQAPAPPATPAPAQPEQPAPSVTPGEPLAVKLEATTEDCSLQYWIDDAQKPSTFTLRKGETRDLPAAQNQVRLNIGNRPAIRMKINNRDVTFPEGTPMWGAKITVNRDNLQTYIK